MTVYGPHNDDKFFWTTWEASSSKFGQNYIIGGDFNTILNPQLDKKNGKQDTHTKCRNTINNIINSCNLIDIWRASHPEQTRYTWHSNGKPDIFCRLNYFLISENQCNIINRAKIKPGYKTDHSIIETTIDNKIQDKGPGYFKQDYCQAIKVPYRLHHCQKFPQYQNFFGLP